MTDKALAVFRCDASPETGGGHVVRCMALAEALAQDGWSIAFAVSDITVQTMPVLAKGSWQVETGFGTDIGDAGRFAELWENCELVVVDHYGLGAEYEKALRTRAHRLLVIDDLANRSHDCDFLCDPTFERDPLDYQRYVPEGCHLMTGAEFALLRPHFATERHHLETAQEFSGINNLLVSLGMSDADNLTLKVLEGINQSAFAGNLTVVIGSSAPHLEDLRRFIDKHLPKATLRTDLDGAQMVAVLAKTDLVIGAAGGSSYERGCLGVPSLVVQMADNQTENITRLEKRGAILSLGAGGELSAEKIARVLNRLLAEPSRLNEMRQSALALADGLGAKRVALALRPEQARDNAPVSFRPVQMRDAQLLYDWQNQPETRRFARNPEIPPYDSHVNWLRSRLEAPGIVFNIILYGDQPTGMLRLDPVPVSSKGGFSSFSTAYEISILVSNRFSRLGIASAALRLAKRLVPRSEIQATVLQGNDASKKLFETQGYAEYQKRYRLTPSG